MNRAPKRLRRDPIVEAICEIRFEGSKAEVSPLLLGLLFSKFGSSFPQHTGLPLASLPEPMRSMEPALKFAPSHRLIGEGKIISVGDHCLSVSMQAPYAGWETFRPLILDVFGFAFGTKLLGEISRLSVKYINLLDFPDQKNLSDVLNVTLELGGTSVNDHQLFQIRREQKMKESTAVLQIANPATLNVLGKPSRRGLIVDIDVVKIFAGEFGEARLGDEIDELHASEKEVFFNLITSRELEAYEPEF